MTVNKPRLSKSVRTVAWLALDAVLLNLALLLAQVVRYSTDMSLEFFANSFRLAPAMTVLFVLVFYGFGLYRTMWQYASASDVLRVAAASFVATALTYGFSLTANLFVRPDNLFRLHRMVYLLHWLVVIALVGAPGFCTARL